MFYFERCSICHLTTPEEDLKDIDNGDVVCSECWCEFTQKEKEIKMNNRDKINELLRELPKALSSVVDGKATVEQQTNVERINSEIIFYSHRIMLSKDQTYS